MNWYLEVMKKYAVFSGRARRKEYWMFVLFNMIIVFVLSFIEGMIGTTSSRNGQSILTNIYQLAVMIPSIAVGIRRMHDTDHSGWWLLFPIVNIIFAVSEGTHGDNKYGSDPKAISQVLAPAETAKVPTPSQPPAPAKVAPSPTPQEKSRVVSIPSKASFQRYTGSGVCDVCNQSIGPNDAYLVPVSVFYGSRKYKEWLTTGPMSFMIQMSGSNVDAYIANARAMDPTTHSAVCSDCIHMFE
jgi:uncharacterized membrane protein YhaH (DUF805 family)